MYIGFIDGGRCPQRNRVVRFVNVVKITVLFGFCLFAGCGNGQQVDGLERQASFRVDGEVSAVVFSTDGKWLFVASRIFGPSEGLSKGMVSRYSVDDGTLRSAEQRQIVNDLALSPKGDRLAIACGRRQVDMPYRDPGEIVLLDANSLDEVDATADPFAACAVAFDETGQRLAVVLSDDVTGPSKFIVVDPNKLAERQEEVDIRAGFDTMKGSFPLAFRGRATAIIADHTEARDGRKGVPTIRFRDLERHRETSVSRKYPAMRLAMSPDGAELAVATSTVHQLVFLNGADGSELGMWRPETTRRFPAMVHALAYAPHSRWLVVAGGDYQVSQTMGQAVVLDRPESTVRARLQFDGRKSEIRAVAVSPDSRVIAFGVEDGRVLLYTVKED
jgi:hypothetical protein